MLLKRYSCGLWCSALIISAVFLEFDEQWYTDSSQLFWIIEEGGRVLAETSCRLER